MAKKGQLIGITQEQVDFIFANVVGRSNQELTDLFNKEFNTNKKLASIRKLKFKYNLYSGIVHIPTYFGGKPIGSIRNKTGKLWIKVGPDKWTQLHKHIWEQANGPVPKGHVIIFGDGNVLNCDLNNLLLVTRQQLLTMNYTGLIKNDATLTQTGIIIADLINVIGKRSIIKKGN